MTPVFLDLTQVLEIHRDQIERYGGTLGVRDTGLLESAVAMPQAGFGDQYFHTDIFEMAAAYLFHIVNNHPFVDGNTRAAAMTAYAFLNLNDFDIDHALEGAFGDLVLALATGTAERHDAATFFRKHARKKRRRR